MGKIRVKTIGEEEKKPAITEAQRSPQKAQKKKKRTVHIPGMKGGERVVSVGPTEEELAITEDTEKSAEALKKKTEPLKKKEARKKVRPQRARSKRYQAAASLIDRNKFYSLSEGLDLLHNVNKGRLIDETVELHILTLGIGISVTATLPHGTHKKTRVAVASDSLIAEVEKGKIDFDVLLADPSMMPKLAKLAKILGPRGLMPNPKAGTISSDLKELAKKFGEGSIRLKTEAKAPIVHVSVGKVSFGPKKLSDNINAVLSAIKKEDVKKVVLKSTQSPGIKISL